MKIARQKFLDIPPEFGIIGEKTSQRRNNRLMPSPHGICHSSNSETKWNRGQSGLSYRFLRFSILLMSVKSFQAEQQLCPTLSMGSQTLSSILSCRASGAAKSMKIQ